MAAAQFKGLLSNVFHTPDRTLFLPSPKGAPMLLSADRREVVNPAYPRPVHGGNSVPQARPAPAMRHDHPHVPQGDVEQAVHLVLH